MSVFNNFLLEYEKEAHSYCPSQYNLIILYDGKLYVHFQGLLGPSGNLDPHMLFTCLREQETKDGVFKATGEPFFLYFNETVICKLNIQLALRWEYHFAREKTGLF